MNAFVQGFRQFIPSPTFWKEVDNGMLKLLVEGESEVDVERLVEMADFTRRWTEDEKKVFVDTLNVLAKKNKGVPPFQNTLNKLLRFFTGSFKIPMEGFTGSSKLDFEKSDTERCEPLVGKTCFNRLRVPSGCLTSVATLEDQIEESVANEGFHLG